MINILDPEVIVLGGGVVEALAFVGPLIIVSGILITLLPALLAYLVGRSLLRMNPALLLGSITGAMTSTPSLNVLTEISRSSVPPLRYAGTYTFANVLLTLGVSAWAVPSTMSSSVGMAAGSGSWLRSRVSAQAWGSSTSRSSQVPPSRR